MGDAPLADGRIRVSHAETQKSSKRVRTAGGRTMYRMQGETSSPEVSARVSKTAPQKAPFALSLQALQKFRK